MGNQLTIRQPEIDIQSLGNILANSGYFQDAKDAGQAIVKVLAGAELGFGPIASMTGINIIKGRVALSANLIAAAIKRSGRYNYRVVQLDNTICELAFYEAGQEIGRSSFTAAEAKAAETQNMLKFPRNMLFARALSNGAKWHCPDIFGGPIYTPEELGARVDGDGEVIDMPALALVENRQPAPAVQPARPAPPSDDDGLFDGPINAVAAAGQNALIARLKTLRGGAKGVGCEMRHMTTALVQRMTPPALVAETEATRELLAGRVQDLWSELNVTGAELLTDLDALSDVKLIELAADVLRRYHASISAVAA